MSSGSLWESFEEYMPAGAGLVTSPFRPCLVGSIREWKVKMTIHAKKKVAARKTAKTPKEKSGKTSHLRTQHKPKRG